LRLSECFLFSNISPFHVGGNILWFPRNVFIGMTRASFVHVNRIYQYPGSMTCRGAVVYPGIIWTGPKLCVQRQTTNVRQRKNLRYKTIRSKWACCFITRMLNYSCVIWKKIWHAEIERKLCQEKSVLPFAVPANAKLKLPKQNPT
jgi:hypothetical protein